MMSSAPAYGLMLGLVLLAVLALNGAATALGGASADGVAAGSTSVAACDSDGFTITHVLSGSDVDKVTVGGIAAACAGGALTVTLTNSSDVSFSTGGPETVLGGGGSVTIDVVPDQIQTDIKEHHLRVVGP